MNHDRFEHDAAPYVLGALSPDERRAYEDHLHDCTKCTRAVRDFAGLPGMLAQVDSSVLLDGGVGDTPPDLLPALVAQARRHHRKRRLALLAGAVAAAVVLPLTGAGVATLLQPPTVGEPEVTRTVSPGRPMEPVGGEAVRGEVAMEGVPWGTRLQLVCEYDAPSGGYTDGPPSYSLVVVTRDGRSEQVATWRAVPGKSITVLGASDADPEDIATVEVRGSSGAPVLHLGS